MPLILPTRNPLAYPCVAPGFDPTHPLAPVCRFSGVSMAGLFVSALNGKPGTKFGTVNPAITLAGPGATVPTGSNGIGFSGFPTSADAAFTCEGIITINSSQVNRCIFSADGGGVGGGSKGFCVRINALAMNICVKPSFTSVSSGLSFVVGVPTHFIASCNASASAFLLQRLDTGAISTATGGGLTGTGSDGTYCLGNFDVTVSNFTPDATFHAMMFSNNYTPPIAQKYVTADPWSFWYPRRQYNFVGAAAAPAGGWGELLSGRRQSLIYGAAA